MLAGKGAKVHERPRPGYICKRAYDSMRERILPLVSGTENQPALHDEVMLAVPKSTTCTAWQLHDDVRIVCMRHDISDQVHACARQVI